MADFIDQNFAFTMGKFPTPKDGDVFIRCNLHRMMPHTAIFVGVRGLRFRDCNLCNCDIPPDAVIEGSGLMGHVSYCSHEHEKWIMKGLPVCGESCAHLVDTDKIIMDGIVVDHIYHYADQRVS